VGVVRGVNLPSPIDFTRRPYNTGHTTVWPCDCVVLLCWTYLAMAYFAYFSLFCLFFYCCCLWWRI